jgi:hypothetical protein
MGKARGSLYSKRVKSISGASPKQAWASPHSSAQPVSQRGKEMFKEVGAVNGKKQKHGYLVSKLARKLACQGVCVVKKGLSATSHPISLLQCSRMI